VLIEQAIFTSADTDRAQGYQLISHSPGLSEADCRELALWGPAHDSLLDSHAERTSTNFHPLASGAYAVSRTSVSGAEYSGRGAAQVYTHFLVLPPKVLLRFANNPFAVVRAATACGALTVRNEISESLEPIRLSGRAPAVNPSLMARLACRPGPTAMATLVQAALSSDQLAVAASTPADALFAGLLNLLPVECRPEFSFSTGLKFSPSRPFRISYLPRDRAVWRAIGRHGVTLLNLEDNESTEELCWEGWAGCVAEFLQSGRISLLAVQLEQQRPTLTCAKLGTFADEVQALLQPPVFQGADLDDDGKPPALEATIDADGASRKVDVTGHQQRSDAAHAQIDGSMPLQTDDGLIEMLAHQPAGVLDVLERVDDLVFSAIAGDRQALAELEVLWPTAMANLSPEVAVQSREQYLRCALSIWSECVDEKMRQPERAMSAIDVLCVLFEE
jgi:hypothetical protein